MDVVKDILQAMHGFSTCYLSAKLTGTDHSDMLRHTNNILAYSTLALYSLVQLG